MKTTTDHLPENKQNELKQIVTLIRSQCEDVEMIILFGSYARGDFREGAVREKGPQTSSHFSDYDLLVVVDSRSSARDHSIWQQIEQQTLDLKMSTHVRIIAHDIEELNIRLAEGHYFFSDIRKEGCMLYDSGSVTLANKRELSPEEQQKIAQDHYSHWFGESGDFFKTFRFHYSEKMWNLAAFDLHQAAEGAYKAILLVFTNYCPQEHYLHILSSRTAEFDEELAGVFPQTTRLEEIRFETLDYAYIGARYDPDYRITQADLDYLSERVQILRDRTETICAARMDEFVQEN